MKTFRNYSADPESAFFFHIKIHEMSPGAIQKSNGLKVTCLMSLYLKSEEDSMENQIFLRLYTAPPPFEDKYLPNVLKSFKNYFSHYTYHCIFFNYKIIIDRILDIT